MDECLKKLYNELKNGNEYFTNKNNYSINKSIIENETMIPSTLNKSSNYFSREIKSKIINDSTYLLTSKCKMFNREYIVNIILCDDVEHFDVEKIFFCIYLWLYVINVLCSDNINKNCSKVLKIDIFMVDYLKELPVSGTEIIGPKHVNSGYTYTCKEINEIIIYREEEWLKVFIHETFHAFGLDFSIFNMSKYQKSIKNMFNIDNDVLLYEAYCETWARVLYVLIYTYVENPTFKFKMFKNISIEQFQKETVHSMIQSCKLLKFMGLNYSILISKDKHLKKSSRLLYKENTHVLCYYVITSLLMFYLDDFLEWCCVENYDCICMPKKIKNVNMFINFIHERYNQEDFLYLMEECLSMKNELSDSSLRMTTIFMDMTK